MVLHCKAVQIFKDSREDDALILLGPLSKDRGPLAALLASVDQSLDTLDEDFGVVLGLALRKRNQVRLSHR